MNIGDLLNPKPHNLHWGGGFGLWDICRHKAIGLPVLNILYKEASDTELKALIKAGIDHVAIPHINKIQDFLQKEELAYPPQLQLNEMNDQQIALAIMEILRLSLMLDSIAFMNVTRKDLRKFIWEITEDDKNSFDKMMNLLYSKNWTMNPPSFK